MPPTNGLTAAREFIEALAKVRKLYQDDPAALKNLLDAASYVVRSDISTGFKWTFARKRETLTAATTVNSGTTAVIVPSASFAGELAIVQLTPAAEAGPVNYVTPEQFEIIQQQDPTGNGDSSVYTIYNQNEFWFWPPAAVGDTFEMVYDQDLMDMDAELPLRFSAFLACVFLYYIGAPPPNDRVTWMDTAKKKLGELKEKDRPSFRGTNFEVPFEEAEFFLGNQ